MADTTIVYEHDTHHLFEVRKADDGTYFAVRNESPNFCFHANSIAELVVKVGDAFKFHVTRNRKDIGL